VTLSSGVHVAEFQGMRECDCGFYGYTDAWYDPEIRTGGWVCPDCAHEHVNNY
jgi:hypothetical protein